MVVYDNKNEILSSSTPAILILLVFLKIIPRSVKITVLIKCDFI